MATHSSILAWKIPWGEEPDGLQSLGSQKVRYNWVTEQWMLEVWSLLSLPFLNPVCTSGRSWFTYCQSLAWRVFEYYLTSMWNECNCVVVWTFFGVAFLWDWNENWPFPVATAEFSKFAGILSVALSQHHLLEFEIAQLESYRFH